MKKWKIVYVLVLVLFGIGGIIMKDYLITALLLSSNFVFLIDSKKSRNARITQLVLIGLAIVLGCLYFYFKVRAARQ
jgi:hypothetical protein